MENEGRGAFDDARSVLSGFIGRRQQAVPDAATQHAILLAAQTQTLLATLQRDDGNVLIATTDQTAAPYQKVISAEIKELRGQLDALAQAAGDDERKAADQFAAQLDKVVAFNDKFVQLAVANTTQHAATISMTEARVRVGEASKQLDELIDQSAAAMARAAADAQAQYDTSRSILIGALIAMVLAAASTALWIGFSISRGLSKGGVAR